MGHHETSSSRSRVRSPSQQRHRHRRKDRDLDREMSSEKRERRSGRDVTEHRSPRLRHDYSYSASDHQGMDHHRSSSNFIVDTERQKEVLYYEYLFILEYSASSFLRLLFVIMLLDVVRRVLKRLLKQNSGIGCQIVEF